MPRFLDKTAINAQCLNAKALMQYFTAENMNISSMHSETVSEALKNKTFLNLVKVWPWRFWRLRLTIQYFRSYDIVFYPNADIADIIGLKIRRFFGMKSKMITTLEGLVGNEQREKLYSNIVGHPVFCQRIPKEHLERTDYILHNADCIIAISPFLAKIGMSTFGDKFIVLPLGIDTSIFYNQEPRTKNIRPQVVSAGSLEKNKRPHVFVDLAKKYPQSDFIWYGDGVLRRDLVADCRKNNISNLSFPGSLQNKALATAFRMANIFVLPSKSEGVPKVTQEAAACGLPVILFGFYEAPSVIDKLNGFVVWSDSELIEKVGLLLDSPSISLTQGKMGAKMGKQWDWKIVAKLWEKQITNI